MQRRISCGFKRRRERLSGLACERPVLCETALHLRWKERHVHILVSWRQFAFERVGRQRLRTLRSKHRVLRLKQPDSETGADAATSATSADTQGIGPDCVGDGDRARQRMGRREAALLPVAQRRGRRRSIVLVGVPPPVEPSLGPLPK